jgi:hypothetical protein
MQQLFVKDSGAWRGTRRVKKEEEGQNQFWIYLFIFCKLLGPSQKTDKNFFVPPHRRARRQRKRACSTLALGAF